MPIASIAKFTRWFAGSTIALASIAFPFATAWADPASVDRMYVLECGSSTTKDLSVWSPGHNAGVARDFSDNCYLIRHGDTWMLWDTGMSDTIAAKPEGVVAGGGILTLYVRKPLVEQLQQLGVMPGDIKYLGLSHFHGDHSGNAKLFVNATLYVQSAEYEAAFGADAAKFGFSPPLYAALKNNPVRKLDGDHDAFGDGSVTIIATPGHTPGHQSLLVRLARRGPVILSGDLTHFDENWVNRRVPARNFDKAQSSESMEKIARLMRSEGAQLWINHDKPQSDSIPHAPEALD